MWLRGSVVTEETEGPYLSLSHGEEEGIEPSAVHKAYCVGPLNSFILERRERIQCFPNMSHHRNHSTIQNPDSQPVPRVPESGFLGRAWGSQHRRSECSEKQGNLEQRPMSMWLTRGAGSDLHDFRDGGRATGRVMGSGPNDEMSFCTHGVSEAWGLHTQAGSWIGSAHAQGHDLVGRCHLGKPAADTMLLSPWTCPRLSMPSEKRSGSWHCSEVRRRRSCKQSIGRKASLLWHASQWREHTGGQGAIDGGRSLHWWEASNMQHGMVSQGGGKKFIDAGVEG